jgi:hypothetical protein
LLLELEKDIDPWCLWPIPSRIVSDVYWDPLPSLLFSKSFQVGKAVWPLESVPTEQVSAYTSVALPSHRFARLEDAFIAPHDMKSTHLSAIVAANIKIVQPPPYIFDFLVTFSHLVTKLIPSTLRERIEVSGAPFHGINLNLKYVY